MIRTIGFSIVFALWLPVLVVAVTFARFGSLPATSRVAANPLLMGLALGWVSAIPSTLAVLLLHRRSPILAYVSGFLLGVTTVFGFIVGGLLGPVGVVGYMVAASIPAWILLGIVAMVQRGSGRQAARV